MSTEATRALISEFIERLEARDWEAWAATMSADVVYEIPQSRERIPGLERYRRFNEEFPGDWHVRPTRVLADGDEGAIWFRWQVGDEPEADAMVFFRCAGGLIVEVVDVWPEPYEPPPGREHLTERW